MAVEYVGMGLVSAGSVSIAPAWAAAHQAGDLGILLVNCEAAELSWPPSGWTAVDVGQLITGNEYLYVAYKFAAISSEPSVNITPISSNHLMGRILVLRGTHPTSPIDTYALGANVSFPNAGQASYIYTDPLYPSVANTMFVLLAGHSVDTSAAGFAGWGNGQSALTCTERGNTSSSIGSGGGIGVMTTNIHSTTAARDFYFASALGTDGFCAHFTLAIAPPAAATPKSGQKSASATCC